MIFNSAKLPFPWLDITHYGKDQDSGCTTSFLGCNASLASNKLNSALFWRLKPISVLTGTV
jgi:hypothetical protein